MNKSILVSLFVLVSSVSVAQKMVPCGCPNETSEKKLFGYCDSLRIKIIIPCQYDTAYSFSDGMARVLKNGKAGYINASGKLIIPAIYDEGEDFSFGFAYVKKGDHYFYINKTGVNQFKKNFPLPAAPKSEGASESVKKLLKQQVQNQQNMSRFYDGLALFYDTANKKKGFINTKGAVQLPAKYVVASNFTEGVAFVRETATAGYAINKEGKKLFDLPEGYMPRPEGYKNGFAIVMKQPKAGDFNIYNYINKKGELLLKETLKEATLFSGNYAVITNKNGEMDLLNQNGKTVLNQSLNYLEASPIRGIYYYSQNTEKGYGLIDTNGNRITEAKYQNFTKLNNNTFICQLANTGVYKLLSTKSGELIKTNRFISYFWMTDKNKIFIRLEGTDLFSNYISLDYEPSTGKFLKEGKPLADKDNFYLNNAEEIAKNQEKLQQSTGAVKYENASFSLRFPEEMELFKDTLNQTVYRNSTYLFSIKKITYKGSHQDFIDAMTNNMKGGNKYESVENESIFAGGNIFDCLFATEKKVSGSSTTGRIFYIPLDKKLTRTGNNELYLISGNYFAEDEKFQKPKLVQTLESIQFK